MRNRIIFVLVVTLLAGAFITWRRQRAKDIERAEIVSTAAQHTPDPRPSPPSPPSTVRKMSKEDRAKLADQIHASLARNSASTAERAPDSNAPSGSAGSNPFPDEPLLKLEDVGPELKGALDDSVSILGECYEQHPGHIAAGSGSDKTRTALALMVLTSDPELGTIIDSDKLTEDDGTPLDAALEGCLRDAIQSLALPPLGKPGKLPLQYTYRFDDDKK